MTPLTVDPKDLALSQTLGPENLHQFMALPIAPNVPAICFPHAVGWVLAHLFEREWKNLSPSAQSYLQWLTVKAESIDALGQTGDAIQTKGFELLAFDISGKSFGGILAQAKQYEISPVLLRFASLLVTLMTMRLLRSQTDLSEEALSALMFTQNVDSEYLNYPMALKRVLSLFPESKHSFYFEVSEHVTSDYLNTIRTLADDLGVHLVLDDSNKMDSTVHWDLLDLTDWIKIDFQATALLEESVKAGNGQHVIAYFERYLQFAGSVHIVLEGLGEESVLKYFLQEHWDHPETELYYQSRERHPVGEWTKYFGLIQDHHPQELGLFFKGI